MLNKEIKLSLDSREDVEFKLLNEEHNINVDITARGIQGQSSAFIANMPYINLPFNIAGTIYKKDTRNDGPLKENYIYNMSGSSTIPKYYTTDEDSIIFHRYYGYVTSGASNAKDKIRLQIKDPANPSSIYYDGNVGTNYDMIEHTFLKYKTLAEESGDHTPFVTWNSGQKNISKYFCPFLNYFTSNNTLIEQYEPYPKTSTIKYDSDFSNNFNIELEENNEDFLGWYKVTPKREYNFEQLQGKIWYENTSYSKSEEITLNLDPDIISDYRITVLDNGEYKPFDEASNVNIEISDFNYGYGVFRRYIRLEGLINNKWANITSLLDDYIHSTSYYNISGYMNEYISQIDIMTKDVDNDRFVYSIPVEYIQVEEGKEDETLKIEIIFYNTDFEVNGSFNIKETLPEVASIDTIQGYKVNDPNYNMITFGTVAVPVGEPDTNAYNISIKPKDSNGNIIENYPCLEVYPLTYGQDYSAIPYGSTLVRASNGIISTGFKYNYSFRPMSGYLLSDSNQAHTNGITWIQIFDKRNYNGKECQIGGFNIKIDGGSLINNGTNAVQTFYYQWGSMTKSSQQEDGGMLVDFTNFMYDNSFLYIYAQLGYGTDNIPRGIPVNITSLYEFEPITLENNGATLTIGSYGNISISETNANTSYFWSGMVKAKLKTDPNFTVEGIVNFIKNN